MGVTNSPIIQSLVQSYGAQGGFKVEYGEAAFTTTALTETLKTNMHRVRAVFLTASSTSNPDERLYWSQASSGNGYAPTDGTITVGRAVPTFYTQIPLDTLSASHTFNFSIPRPGLISEVTVTTGTSLAINGTNYYGFGLLNKTQTLVPVNIATVTNTTNTGGSAITAWTPLSLTLAAAAQLDVNANDVFEFAATETGAAASLVGCALRVGVTPDPTSALAFNYLIIGV